MTSDSFDDHNWVSGTESVRVKDAVLQTKNNLAPNSNKSEVKNF